jgi:hypothetical protein
MVPTAEPATVHDPTKGEAETYEPVTCTVCARVHLVNPKTRGKPAFDRLETERTIEPTSI